MNDSSIVIKLSKDGMQNEPTYNLTVYDSGKVVYEGLKNVKMKGKIETLIDEDKIVLILEKLKDSGLFNINQKYTVDESTGRPFTRLSVDMPDEEGKVKTKSVSHYNDDPMIPHSLKIFEDKIDEIAESYNWVETSKTKKNIKPAPVKSSPGFGVPVKKISSKKTGKFVVIAAVMIIIVLCLAFFMFFNTGDDELSDVTYGPEIIMFTPASSVSSYQNYIAKSVFELNDVVYLYAEYKNISTTNDDTNCNLFLKLDITDDNGKIFWSYSEDKTDVGNNAHYWTIYTNSSWTSSEYNANLYIYDYNTGLSVTGTESFSINQ